MKTPTNVEIGLAFMAGVVVASLVGWVRDRGFWMDFGLTLAGWCFGMAFVFMVVFEWRKHHGRK